MGVGIHSAIHLFKIADKLRFRGELLTLGVQDACFTTDRLREMALRYSLPPPPSNWQPVVNNREPFKSRKHITGDSLWSYLGFNSVTSVDVSDYEEATTRLDLNEQHVPEKLRGKFDVVFDGGTIEHVFHLPNALRNLHELTKVGGVIIHQTPSLPLIDHGFYMFSPTFFHDYYTANGYEIVDLQLVMYSVNWEHEPCWFTDYTPGCLAWVSNKGYCFPGMNFLVLGAFRKRESSTGDVIPQQGAYVKHWERAMTINSLTKWQGTPQQ
ncbi:MAG TPA: hypothetical protein DDZ88_00030 [Verrucomicrobiales bacterium]|nr:hypothetical protein [Verrucomicrobiales bacterium]